MLAIISLVVVLPLLPVTAISGSVKRQRQSAASAPSDKPRLGDLNEWQTQRQQAFGGVGGDHGGDRAARGSSGDVIVAIEIIAAQGDEQLAVGNTAAIGRYAAKGPIVADQLAGSGACSAQQIHHHAHRSLSRRASSAARACVTSENGRRTPAIS
jgi:hypothetical protein